MRRTPALPSIVLAVALVSGCEESSSRTAAGSVLEQTAWRLRTDVTAALDADTGWGAALNEAATVAADQPFRLRVEVAGAAGADRGFTLESRRNDGEWTAVLARDFPYPDEISTPRVSVVQIDAYPPGAATTDLLDGSDRAFTGGAGVVLDSATVAWPGQGQSEWEWPLVIRRWADGAVTNEPGDRFDFRMVDSEGRPLGGRVATVHLEVPAGHLGGTYAETPGRLGPWSADDGTLYFPMEPAETWNALMMMVSRDGGAEWVEADAAGRPATVDLEGFATALHAGRVHMLHQTDSVFYHAFATTDDPAAPEGWAATDELVSVSSDPPSQTAAVEARGDGSVVAIYGDSLGLRLRIRSADGAWGDERILADEDGALLTGVQSARTDDDRVHIAYAALTGDERTIRHRTLHPDGALSAATTLADGIGTAVEEDAGALAPLVYLPGLDQVVVIYRDATGRPWERRVAADGSGPVSPPLRIADRAVVQNAVDADQAGFDAVGADNTVHLFFIDEESREVAHVAREGSGPWTAPRTVIEGADVQWIRGVVGTGADGEPVYSVVIDAGSDGGSGMNRYLELPLSGG
ncbi:exo-alpha-sialidase [Gaopeijia maritima]|uniref:exo-alpha-sialidase n=1 Tax=Gaopeijia maritima TaxID=3119007 RepID=UPI0032464D2E